MSWFCMCIIIKNGHLLLIYQVISCAITLITVLCREHAWKPVPPLYVNCGYHQVIICVRIEFSYFTYKIMFSKWILPGIWCKRMSFKANKMRFYQIQVYIKWNFSYVSSSYHTILWYYWFVFVKLISCSIRLDRFALELFTTLVWLGTSNKLPHATLLFSR